MLYSINILAEENFKKMVKFADNHIWQYDYISYHNSLVVHGKPRTSLNPLS